MTFLNSCQERKNASICSGIKLNKNGTSVRTTFNMVYSENLENECESGLISDVDGYVVIRNLLDFYTQHTSGIHKRKGNAIPVTGRGGTQG
jgi:hypothetical protein